MIPVLLSVPLVEMSTKLPPGVAPNYVDPPSEGWKVLTSTAVTLTFAIVFVILRLVVKLTKTHSPGWDDCTCNTRPTLGGNANAIS